MALQGYLASIKGQSGTTVLTDAATTTTNNLSFRIANTTLDINTPVVVKVNNVVVTTGFTINYGNCTITFASPVVQAVTISGKRADLTELAQGRSYTFNGSRDVLDNTTFNKAFRTYQAGLITGTAEIVLFYVDAFFFDWLTDGEVKVVELMVNATESIRFYALLSSDTINIPVEGLIEESVSLQITKELGIYA
jgi:hypothetical protein